MPCQKLVYKTLSIITFCFIVNTSVTGQSVIVKDIQFIGNKITKDGVIFRELDIAIGDTISLSALGKEIERNQKRLLSTGLFNIVTINIKEWDTSSGTLTILIDLKENWYIYPSVIWEYADRSFNVWWKEHRFDFSRTNYGVRLDHLNLTGHKDRLKLKYQSGYTKKYEAVYNYPYFIGQWGLGGSLFYSTKKETGYITEGNKSLFYQHPDERVIVTRFRAGLSLSNRSNAYSYHSFRLEYHDNKIDDTIAKGLNPNYFLDGKNQIKFFYAEYDFQYDKRVFPTYPEGGYLLFLNIKKEGFGIFDDFDNLSISGGFEKYFKLSNNLVYGGRVKGKINLNRNKVGFGNNSGLGYGDEVRGYELYVVDGIDFFLTRTDFKFRFYDNVFDVSKYMFIKQFDLFPFTAWLRASLDFGFVNEPTYYENNFLSNVWQIGGGPGIDMLIYNNYKLSLEYNFNRLGESGLYFQGAFNF